MTKVESALRAAAYHDFIVMRVYADWLMDQDRDLEAEAWRWLAENEKVPELDGRYRWLSGLYWGVDSPRGDELGAKTYLPHILPKVWHIQLPFVTGGAKIHRASELFDSWELAYDTAVTAYTRLSSEEREIVRSRNGDRTAPGADY
jgi:hypothetical protein